MKIPKRLKPEGAAKQRSRQQEHQLARRIGGRPTPGSGNGSEKGDVRLHRVARIEAKTTTKASFSLTVEIVEKIEAAAMSSGEVPAIVVEFIGADGKPKHELCIMPSWALQSLLSPPCS